MAIVLTAAAALIVWVVLFSIEFNSFVGLMIAIFMVLLAGTLKLLLPALPSRSGRQFSQD
jgi:predicted membrane protein